MFIVYELIVSFHPVRFPKIYRLKQSELQLFLLCYVCVCMCDTWSITLREEHRLRVFENRVLRIIFALKRERITRYWWKWHTE
jgi:hypothetical protein